ncbi:prolyl oligopeptidase family serine peptidase [Kutzneria viridogrisea]|uniref:prolyl oligopeptidase n=1 Tax=Kutzneria viridogrisea TaxID=47990 RepID=A0ABR6BMI6_9PSEU|nr:prolyl oligopeptidase [Kutzneria viridogrisea]
MTKALPGIVTYPKAPRLDLVEDLHGHPVADPYRWLEDPADQRTVDWSQDQDALTGAWLSGLPGREPLESRLHELLRAGSVGVPVWRSGRAFFTRRAPGEEHPSVWLREADGSECVLIDVAALDESGSTTLDTWSPSREGTLLAYQVSVGGNEHSLLHVLDVDSGELVEGPIDRCRYSPIGWLPGGAEFFYVRQVPADQVPEGEELFHRRVWRHRVGTDPSTDVVVHGEGMDPTYYFGVSTSQDGRWLVVDGRRGTTQREAVWICDLHQETPAMREVLSDSAGARCDAWVAADGRLYLLTTLDAPRGRLCVADPEHPTPEAWTELVPEEDDSVLNDAHLLGDVHAHNARLVLLRTRHAVSELHLHIPETGAHEGVVPLPSTGSVHGLSVVDAHTPSGADTLWLGWTDFTTPVCVRAFRLGAAETTLWAAAPGSVAVPDVHTQQLAYRSADGTVVRMFVISRSSHPDQPRPVLMTGYGGFAVSRRPGYNSSALAWVQAGGVWVVVSLRGGGEEGEQWHRAGMREAKQNVFDDFHAAAEHLIRTGWTTPEQLAIMGGSNGGLLVGAALTQRPELYRAVVCSAPLLDMVRYERFLLGRLWAEEYGSASVAEELAWLLAYSPYHRVCEDVEYPTVLFTVFESDSRVDPNHARKMCAALQHATSGDPTKRPVLIRRETEVGHAGRSLSRGVRLAVDELGFLANAVGLDLEALST